MGRTREGIQSGMTAWETWILEVKLMSARSRSYNYCVCYHVGLHRSAEKEDILKYKCFHAMQCDKLLEKLSAEV